MTIDERLEALAQTLELLSSLHRDLEKHAEEAEARNQKRMAEIEARDEKRMGVLTEAMTRNEKRMGQMMDAITRLARIADAHQDRLDDHGERIGRLEGGPPRPAKGRPRRA